MIVDWLLRPTEWRETLRAMQDSPMPIRPTYWGLFVHLLGEVPACVARETARWRERRSAELRGEEAAPEAGEAPPPPLWDPPRPAEEQDFGVFSGGDGIDQHPDGRDRVDPEVLAEGLDELWGRVKEHPGEVVETAHLRYDPATGGVSRKEGPHERYGHYSTAGDQPPAAGKPFVSSRASDYEVDLVLAHLGPSFHELRSCAPQGPSDARSGGGLHYSAHRGVFMSAELAQAIHDAVGPASRSALVTSVLEAVHEPLAQLVTQATPGEDGRLRAGGVEYDPASMQLRRARSGGSAAASGPRRSADAPAPTVGIAGVMFRNSPPS